MQTRVYAKKNSEWNQSLGTTSASLSLHCSVFEFLFFCVAVHALTNSLAKVDQGKRHSVKTRHNSTANHKPGCEVHAIVFFRLQHLTISTAMLEMIKVYCNVLEYYSS